MADADYQRLGAACGVAGCEDGRSARSTPHVCQQCGIEFIGTLKQKFCARSCSTNFNNDKQKIALREKKCGECGKGFIGLAWRAKCKECGRAAQGRSSLTKALHTHTCRVCATEYQNIAAKSNLCSNKCKLRAWKTNKGHYAQAAKARETRQEASVAAKALAHKRFMEAAAQKQALRVAKAYWDAEMKELSRLSDCVVCGRTYRRFGLQSVCSTQCGESRYRATRHAGRVARRAILKAARVEPVDPIKVCERDNWRCYLCGCETPKAMRGTYEPNAPEVDHVVPVTRGGKDCYSNVKCSCRSCNGIKSNFLLEEIGGAFVA